MKQSAKTIVEAIEKEIEYLKNNSYLFEHSNEKDFEFGKLYFEIEVHERVGVGGEWDEVITETLVKITPKSVTVTNENSKVLTNLSNEVFNQLEDNYTNY